MKISIIGSGNIGTSLAKRFIQKQHQVTFGVRDVMNFKGKSAFNAGDITVLPVQEAVQKNDIVIIAVPAAQAASVASTLGDVKDKIIIDTMNSVAPLPGYDSTAHAILANCNCTDVVKCFNTTGYENILDPVYNGQGIDMFTAGDSVKATAVATKLANDIGFDKVYHLGGNDKFGLIEKLAICWINLAIVQKLGRNIAFKVVKR